MGSWPLPLSRMALEFDTLAMHHLRLAQSVLPMLAISQLGGSSNVSDSDDRQCAADSLLTAPKWTQANIERLDAAM